MEMADDGALEDKPLEEVVEVALHSMVRLSSPKTLKLKGLIGATEVIVLIDSA